MGYDLWTDTAYVYSYEKLEGRKNAITVADQYAEAWEKARGARRLMVGGESFEIPTSRTSNAHSDQLS